MSVDVKVIFAKNIKKLRKQKNLTQLELGEALGLGKTTISEWESAKKLPNAGSIQKIANFFGIPNSVLFEEEHVPITIMEEIVHLPIIGKISCGSNELALQEIEAYEPTPKQWLNEGEFFYLKANGEKMTGLRIRNGDLLLIKKQALVENGKIAVMLMKEEVMLKRVYKRDGIFFLQSEDPEIPPIIIDEGEALILGKLIKVIINL
ncbi:XRE family transcriptional regulator [Paenibacillus larvae]